MTSADSFVSDMCKDFNSHAHVERDERDWDENVLKGISTHTLTWSVTVTPSYVAVTSAISTHTLTWSVTGITGYKQAEATFQLTRSRGA